LRTPNESGLAYGAQVRLKPYRAAADLSEGRAAVAGEELAAVRPASSNNFGARLLLWREPSPASSE